MKKMNKILALLTAGALLFGCMFTSCSNASGGNEKGGSSSTTEGNNPEDDTTPEGGTTEDGENPTDSNRYSITINTMENGSVNASKTSGIAAGEIITLTVTADSGYELDTLSVKNGDAEVSVSDDNSFTMPAANVTVSATFKSKNTIPNDFVKVIGATVSNVIDGSSIFTGDVYTIPTMYVCNHEVTQKEYETYCDYSSNKTGQKPSEEKGLGDDFPAYYVSWNDAIVYCNLRSVAENLTPVYSINNETDVTKWQYTKSYTNPGKYHGNTYEATKYDGWQHVTADPNANGYRLPTNAEWEYIARGGNDGILKEQTKYSGSNKARDVAWYSQESVQKIQTKAPNTLGIYDMSGNVSEWNFDYQYEEKEYFGSVNIATSAFRKTRGGNWFWGESYCTLNYYNEGAVQTAHADTIGFRVVRNAE